MDTDQYRAVAGASLVGAGTVSILAFSTAAALVPGYSVAQDTISALGATGGTAASRAVFNAAMVDSGALVLLAAYGLHRAYGRRLLTGVTAATGLGGFVGVGLFPAQTGLPHFVAAVIAFTGAGVAALVVAATVRGPFRYVSAVLGGLELVALALFVTLGGATALGVGGLERWVAYLGLAWAVAFGGALLSDGTRV
ncbi:MAG: DUF998 domain-containing protein [Haloarculaceae archaeon]